MAVPADRHRASPGKDSTANRIAANRRVEAGQSTLAARVEDDGTCLVNARGRGHQPVLDYGRADEADIAERRFEQAAIAGASDLLNHGDIAGYFEQRVVGAVIGDAQIPPALALGAVDQTPAASCREQHLAVWRGESACVGHNNG